MRNPTMPEPTTKHPTLEQLSAFAVGKLSKGLSAVVARHVAGCPACQGKLEGEPADSFLERLKELGPKGGRTATTAGNVTPGGGAPGLAEVPAELASSRKYEVLGKLGEGGMGAVWKAKHAFLDCLVAIKVMNASASENQQAQARFLLEMRAAGKLMHPHIVRAHDAELAGERLLLVMEYVEGINLDQLVAQKGPLRVDFACRLVAQAAEGLQHAHERGMAHRDVKPANLMVTKATKEVKILDFGLARLPRDEGQDTGQTKLRTFLGTPEYVAPEQATDAAKADIRADVYSLGCTLFFLLTGRPPFRGETTMATILSHLNDAPPPLADLRPGVPAGLAAAVAKMLAKAPADRYQTPGEVAAAVRPFTVACEEVVAKVEMEPVAVAAPESQFAFDAADDSAPPRRSRKKAQGNRLLYALAFVALFLINAGIVVLLGVMWNNDQEKPKSGKSIKDGKGAPRPVKDR